MLDVTTTVTMGYDLQAMKDLEADGTKARDIDDIDDLRADFCMVVRDRYLSPMATCSGRYVLEADAYGDAIVVAHVERIDTEAAYRGRGYARSMLQRVAEHCAAIYAAAEDDSAAAFWRHIGCESVTDDAWGSLDVGYGVYRLPSYRIR